MQRMSVLFWVSNCQIFKLKIKKMQSEIQKQKLLHTCIFSEFTSVLYIHAYISSRKQRMDGRMDGWMDGWMDG